MDCYDPSTKSVPFMVLKSYGRTGSVKIPYIFFNLYMCIRLCQYFLTNRISSNYHQFISRYNEWNLLKPYKIVQKKQQLYPFNIKMIPKLLKKGGGIKCGLTGYVATYASLAVYISISMKLIATHLNKKIIFSDCTLCIF